MAEIPYTVQAYFRVDSDWGSAVIVTSRAAIREEPGFVYPPEVSITPTQIFFGAQNSLKPTKINLPFLIVGSTEPVDIITSHGDASVEGPESGSVVVELRVPGVPPLINDTLTGDGVNAKVFPQVPLYLK